MKKKIYLSIIPIIIILLLCIIVGYSTTFTNINCYLTNKMVKLNFISDFQFRSQYPKSILNNPPIYIFYHVGINESTTCFNTNKLKYKQIINDQLNKLIYSGLYERCEAIYYGCNGLNSDIILKQFFADYTKIIPLEEAISPNTKTYENKTINAMIKFSKEKGDSFYGLYIHTKGITHPKDTDWRDYMEYWLINKHRICIDALDRGFNTVGTGLIYKYPKWTILGIMNYFRKYKWDISYTGNFYWFNSKYLKKCDYIADLNYRFNAEYFLFKKYEKNKHINIDNIRYYGFVADYRYYNHKINNNIKIAIY
jgi:hypothetical protein